MFIKVAPFLFVILWATGFVGAKFGLAYAEPATLLAIRMMFTVLLFLGLLSVFKRQLPRGKAFTHHAVSGLLIHGLYLCGVWQAIEWGMPAGLSSLLVGTQPILTAFIMVSVANEKFRLSQWLGIFLGWVGISLVLLGDIEWQPDANKFGAIALCIVALLGITLGTLYQKRYCAGQELLGAATVQYIAAGVFYSLVALAFEERTVNWNWQLAAVMAWMVLVLSCVAILLLLYMVEKGAASKVASVFYLVPPVAAVQSWIAFDERLGWAGIMGFVTAAFAVYLVVKEPRQGKLSQN